MQDFFTHDGTGRGKNGQHSKEKGRRIAAKVDFKWKGRVDEERPLIAGGEEKFKFVLDRKQDIVTRLPYEGKRLGEKKGNWTRGGATRKGRMRRRHRKELEKTKRGK